MGTLGYVLGSVIAISISYVCAYIDPKKYANTKSIILCSFFGTIIFDAIFMLFKMF